MIWYLHHGYGVDVGKAYGSDSIMKAVARGKDSSSCIYHLAYCETDNTPMPRDPSPYDHPRVWYKDTLVTKVVLDVDITAALTGYLIHQCGELEQCDSEYFHRYHYTGRVKELELRARLFDELPIEEYKSIYGSRPVYKQVAFNMFHVNRQIRLAVAGNAKAAARNEAMQSKIDAVRDKQSVLLEKMILALPEFAGVEKLIAGVVDG